MIVTVTHVVVKYTDTIHLFGKGSSGIEVLVKGDTAVSRVIIPFLAINDILRDRVDIL